MCFVDLEKAFDSILRRVLELAVRRKGIQEVFGSISEESV